MGPSSSGGRPPDPLPSPRADAARRQTVHLRRLVRHAWHASAFYRERYAAHGIRAGDLDHLTVRDLPFVTKQLLMDHFDDAVTDRRLRKAGLERWLDANRDPRAVFDPDFVVMTSSGSSGLLGIFVYDRAGWSTMSSLAAPWLPPPEPRGPGKPRVAFWLVTAGHTGGIVSSLDMPRSRFDTLGLSLHDPLESVVDALNAFQPDRLVGYASTVTALAEAALEGRLRIQPRQVLVGSEVLAPAMEDTIRAAWGTPVHELYVATESVYVAIRPPGAPEFAVLDDVTLVEILDGADGAVAAGDAGRVVVTNLHNHALPIIRYELGDQVVAGSSSPDRPVTAIRRILGRVLGARSVPVRRVDGTPDQLSALVAPAFYVPGVSRVQLVSVAPGAVRVDYVSSEPRDEAAVAELRRLLALQGASGTEVSARRVPELSPDPRTGKVPLMRIEAEPPSPPAIAVAPPPSPRRTAPTQPFEPIPRSALARSVPARFEEVAARAPGRPAIVDDGGGLTYAELNRRANRLGREILARDPAGPGPVAVLADHHAATVVAILAALKAGKVFVPLDPTFPPARLARMLADARPSLALAGARHSALAASLGLAASSIVDLDAMSREGSDTDIGLAIAPEAPAYILYTSGSTGEPRGVVHGHAGVLHNALRYVAGVHLSADDRITMLLSFSFSAGMTNALPPLLVGAALCPYDVRERGLAGLGHFLERQAVTVYMSVPTAFRHFCETLPADRTFPAIRMVELAGEPVTAADAARFRTHFREPSLLHVRFGAAETHLVSQHFVDHEMPVGDGVLPVGYPLAEMESLVVDEVGRRLDPGETGEIAVRSRYLAIGYWRQPERTRAAFVPDSDPGETDLDRVPRLYRTGDLGRLRADGCLEVLGRTDSQIKIRGQRLDAGEVERALLHAGAEIAEAAVVAREERPGDARLVAYVVARSGARHRPSAPDLRRRLGASLPDYMIPSAFVWLSELPLTPTGKLDRRALPAPEPTPARATRVEPRTPIEARLAGIWAEVLGVEHVDVNESFFDAGGDSLSAMRILARVRDRLGVELPPRVFFESATIAALAAALVDLASERSSGDQGDGES